MEVRGLSRGLFGFSNSRAAIATCWNWLLRSFLDLLLAKVTVRRVPVAVVGAEKVSFHAMMYVPSDIGYND
jgi:hypothetical protein